MSDYAAYIPVVNRFDLLDDAINNAREAWDDLTVIDNSRDGKVTDLFPYVKVARSIVPLSFTQSMNYEFIDTVKRGKRFTVHMHSDSLVPPGAIARLLEKAREIDSSGTNWGVIYTHYDVLAVYNPVASLAIGGFDTIFHDYWSDNDFYRRMELAGYERINTDIKVGHIGSQTINSEPYLRRLNGITFPLMREYYRQKWDGLPGEEKFITPFGL